MSRTNFNEGKWQAQADADTMARYQEIISDSKRKNRAMREARRQADDLQKRLNAMKSIGKKK